MKHLFLFIFLGITSTVVSQKTLQYNLNVGDHFTIQQEAEQHITQVINGVDQIIENNLIGVMYFEVIEATPENYTLTMKFKRLKMLMDSLTLGELSNADTESTDSSNVTNMLFKGLLNVPVTIVMEKSGKIKAVTGGDKLIASMFASAGIDQPEIIEASKDQMEKQFGSNALSNSFEQMTHLYPEDAVSAGTDWTNSYVGNMSANNNWKLDSSTNKELLISGTATTIMSTVDENIMMILKGTQESKVIANPKTGLFTQIIVTGENSGDTFFHEQNMTIPTTIKSKIIYKISE
ncbi:MAG: DUF6263 family protein [Aquaticitalea sp.]